MTLSNQHVDAITQSVLRELKSRGIAVARSANRTLQPSGSESGPDGVDSGLRLLEKVVTEEALKTANAAGRTISVIAGAIITPSGHDYIRRHRVTIASTLTPQATATSGTVVIVGNCPTASSAAQTAGWTAINAGCERDAASKVRKYINSGVVCCGGEASVTACLSNRDASVRAAVITPNTDVPKLVAAMQPNVLCLQSSWAFSQLLKLLRKTSFGPAVPENWKELSR